MKRTVRTVLALSLGLFSLAAAFSAEASAASLPKDRYFTLKDVTGKPVALEGLLKEKKAVLINFWATWCPPCREEIPDLIRLQDRFKDKGFTVIGVDIAETPKKVTKFADKFKINYPIVIDADRSVSESYGIVGIPTSLLVSSDGTVLGEFHAAGPDLFEAVEKALR